PRCQDCPLRVSCKYVRASRDSLGRAQGTNAHRARRANAFVGSSRFYRGLVMRALARRTPVSIGVLGREVKRGFSVTDGAWLQALLASLERDGLVRFDRARKKVRLP